MFAMGCGNSRVGDQGILERKLALLTESWWMLDTREHQMQWYSQLLCTMNMREAGRVGNYGIRDERSPRLLWRVLVLLFHFISICARFPATLENLSHALSPFAHVALFKRFHSWYKAWIFDHKCHQLCRVTTYIEELQAIFLNELFECSMCCQPHSMAIFTLEHLAERNEWLDISSRANHVNDNVKWWRGFVWSAIDIRRRGCGCWRGLRFLLGELDLLELFRKRSIGFVNAYFETSVI